MIEHAQREENPQSSSASFARGVRASLSFPFAKSVGSIGLMGLALCTFATGCSNKEDDGSGCEMRGCWVPTTTGATELVFPSADLKNENPFNRGCTSYRVDERAWGSGLDTPGTVAPGQHLVDCGAGTGAVGILVPEGTRFTFNAYWGP